MKLFFGLILLATSISEAMGQSTNDLLIRRQRQRRIEANQEQLRMSNEELAARAQRLEKKREQYQRERYLEKVSDLRTKLNAAGANPDFWDRGKLAGAAELLLHDPQHNWKYTGVKNSLAQAMRKSPAAAALMIREMPVEQITPGIVEAVLTLLHEVPRIRLEESEINQVVELLNCINAKLSARVIRLERDADPVYWKIIAHLQTNESWRIGAAAQAVISRSFPELETNSLPEQP